jgi:hypothetical protein
MTKSTKYITMAEAVARLDKNPKIQKAIAEIKRKREISPARHNRQYCLELMNISMELNGRCQLIGWATHGLLDDTLSMQERKQFLERRREEVLVVTDLQVRHDKLVAELDQAIIDEDNAKLESV